MGTYLLKCTNGESETRIRLKEQLIGVAWECLDKEIVWGTPYKGTSFGPLIAQGEMQLSLTDILHDCGALAVGSSGKGDHIESNGGSFPTGEFDWLVIQN